MGDQNTVEKSIINDLQATEKASKKIISSIGNLQNGLDRARVAPIFNVPYSPYLPYIDSWRRFQKATTPQSWELVRNPNLQVPLPALPKIETPIEKPLSARLQAAVDKAKKQLAFQQSLDQARAQGTLSVKISQLHRRQYQRQILQRNINRLARRSVGRPVTKVIEVARKTSLFARGNLIVLVSSILMEQVAARIVKANVQKLLKEKKSAVKRTVKIALQQLNGTVTSTLQNAANNIDFNVAVDTSRYDRAIKEYMKWTKRSAVEIVNQKAYWITINAIRETYKANRQVIRVELQQPSNNMPGLNVSEAIAVYNNSKGQRKKLTKAQIKAEGRKIITSRTRSIGFLKSGWIPAAKRLAPLVKKRLTVGSERLQQGKEKGGAKPAITTAGVAIASIWNAIEAEGHVRPKAHMRIGLQKALDKEAASMISYVENKMRQNAAKFRTVK